LHKRGARLERGHDGRQTEKETDNRDIHDRLHARIYVSRTNADMTWLRLYAAQDNLGTPFATSRRYGINVGPKARFIPTGRERCGRFWNSQSSF
jgi:hypothetical protein